MRYLFMEMNGKKRKEYFVGKTLITLYFKHLQAKIPVISVSFRPMQNLVLMVHYSRINYEKRT